MSLVRQTAVVTGAATSLGELVVRKLKARGATVIALDLRQPLAASDLFFRMDMMDLNSISRAVNSLPYGIDLLCNLVERGAERKQINSVCDYVQGVETLIVEASQLISNGGTIINISPLPEWNIPGSSSFKSRGIKVRHLERAAGGNPLVPVVISEMATSSFPTNFRH